MQVIERPTIDGARDALAPAIASLHARLECGDVNDRELIEILQRAAAITRLAEGLLVAATDEVAQRSRGAQTESFTTRYGARSVVELVRATTRCDHHTARKYQRAAALAHRDTRLTDGSQLPGDFPALSEALRGGDISVVGYLAAAKPLADAASRMSGLALAEADAELAALARGTTDRAGEHRLDAGDEVAMPAFDADSLGTLSRKIVECSDPDGAVPTEEVAVARRCLHLGTPRDGLVPIRGLLLPDVASALLRLQDAILNPRRRIDAGDSDVVGDADDGDEDVCPKEHIGGQQRHDALASIVEMAARCAEAGTIGGAAPTLVVTMSAKDYAQRTGWARLDGLDLSTS